MKFFFYITFVTSILIYGVLSAKTDEVTPFHPTPTKLLAADKWPDFTDDLDFTNMELALNRQIERFRELNLEAGVTFGDRRYKVRDQLRAAEMFLALVQKTQACFSEESKESCYTKLNQDIRESFLIYVPNTDEKAFFTAYYTPTLTGTSQPTAENSHSIYKKPNSESLRTLSRVEIDFDKKLEGKDLELGFFPDLFDLFLLHVQGGGKMIVDGKSHYISYDGTNSQKFRFICRHMQDMGYISSCSVSEQRRFLAENPDKHREIYATSPSYVWFKKTPFPPLGNDSVSLTDYRSIAQDDELYRHKGTIAFIKTVKPIPAEGTDEVGELQPYSRFFIDQDTGGAIVGAARADLYFGEGPDAPFVAYNMKYDGEIFFLMPK